MCIVLAAMGSAFVVAGAAGAGMPTGGQIRVFVTPGNVQGNGKVVVAGAIGDYGRSTRAPGGMGKVILSKGTFEVNLNAIRKELESTKPMLENTTTCSFVFGATAPAAVSNGTGLYAGIKGTLRITETFAGYGPFYRSGAHKGQCDTSPNSQPIAQWASVIAVGTVTFS